MTVLINHATSLLRSVRAAFARLSRILANLKPYRPEQHYMRGRKGGGGGGPSAAAHG